jgi:hypothetical protein
VAPTGDAVQVELSGAGGIQLSLPEGISARLEAHTGSGRIALEPSSLPRSASRNHLETVLGSGDGAIRLRTSHGDIAVRLANGR